MPYRSLLTAALIAALSACATVVPPVANTPASTIEKPLMPQAVKGRISATATDGEGKAQPFHGSFELTLDPPEGESGQLMLLTPIGSTVAILGWTKSSAILRRPQGGVEMYPSLQDMLQQTIGISLSAAMLRNWLIGTPIDGVPIQSLGPGHFTQLGWDISTTLNEDTKRPKLITMKRAATADLPQAELRLVIDEMTP
jgi:outer membrane lipoprotein LolB